MRGPGHVSREKAPVERLVTRTVLLLLANRKMRTLLSPSHDVPDLTGERDRITAQLDELASAYAAGQLNISQLTKASENLRARLADLESTIADSTRGDVLREVLSHRDLITAWEELSLSRKRAVIDALMTVTIEPVGRGGNKSPKRTPRDGITIGLKHDALNDADLADAILAHRITGETEKRIVRAFAA